MIAADLLHVAVHSVVLSGVSLRWMSVCICACSAGASAPHFALHSHVQASCLERAWPAAFVACVRAFPGALAAHAAAAPGRLCRERMREAGMQGKIEGGGTTVRAMPVCTWVWGGTRHKVASCRRQSQCLAANGEFACWSAMALYGATP